MSTQSQYGFSKVIPFFKSTNIPATVAFYRDTLHFKLDMAWPKEANEPNALGKGTFASISDKDHLITLFAMAGVPASMAVVAMSHPGLEAYHDRLTKEGKLSALTDESTGSALGKIELKEWGQFQFSVKDLDGNTLMFSAPQVKG
jgi:uncharacterized glyoxalase superfamily protein PhnB